METSSIPAQPQPFAPSAYHEEVRSQAEGLASRFADRHREVRLYPFEHGELYPELWREISERGWPGLLVPAEHGGAEGGLLAYVVVMEALAASNLILWMPVLGASIGHAIARGRPRSGAAALARADRVRGDVPRSRGHRT